MKRRDHDGVDRDPVAFVFRARPPAALAWQHGILSRRTGPEVRDEIVHARLESCVIAEGTDIEGQEEP